MINDDGMSSIRGIAALIVVVAHANQIFVLRFFGLEHVIAKISGQMAAHAVLIFFVVSGYLISLSILKNIERNGGSFDLLEYVSSRISRIYPPLIFSVVVCLVIYSLIRLLELPGGDFEGAQPFGLIGDLYVARPTFKIDTSDVAGLLLMKNGFLQANGPLWSLFIEWRIYIAAACLAMIITCARPIHRIIWSIGLVYTLIQLKTIDSNALFYSGVWLLGCGMAYLHNRAPIAWTRGQTKIWVLPIVLLAVYLYFEPGLIIESRNLSTATERSFQFLFGVLYASLLFPIAPVARAVPRLVLMRLGDFSYTLYIVHFPVMLFVLSLSQDMIGQSVARSLMVALAAVLFVLLLSFYSGRYLEQKNRFLPVVRAALSYYSGAKNNGIR